jgi:hypothetical protein
LGFTQVNFPGMGFDHSLNDTEPQAGSPFFPVGGEEGSKKFIPVRRRDAQAIIPHIQNHLVILFSYIQFNPGCSHSAGRAMSRNEAKRRFSVEDHIKATEGVECRKDKDVIDETPAAYKDIDAVMEAQKDLVEIVHTLRQIICVKG